MPLFRPARVRNRAARTAVRTTATALTALAATAALLSPLSGPSGLFTTPAYAAPAAASREVAGGRLDWGIKASFQSYVTGPIAQGSWSPTGGADTAGGEQFRFPSARGSYDPGTGALSAAFQGGVHFLGHRQANGTWALDLTIARPSVRVSGRTGTLYADMTGKDKATGKVTTSAQVPLAALDLGSVGTRGVTGPRITLTGVPATLTTQGARAFAGYYTAGTALDPVSLSVDLRSAPPATTTPKPSPTLTRRTRPVTTGRVVTAAVDWGVRRTFREYVTGDIAQGRWTLADGARDGGALFRFGAGRGAWDASRHTLDARFSGTLRFLGMRADDGTYGLDLKIGGVRVALAGTRGTLYADGVPFVTFTAPAGLAARDGLLAVREAPTRLTAQGAARFAGLYTAGTAMDPLTVSVALDKAAALPALPDIGSAPAASSDPAPGTAAADPSPTPATPAAAATPVAEAAGTADSGPSTGLIAAAALAALAAAGAVTAVLVRRRRRDPAA